MKKFKMKSNKWIIYVGNYGSFLFEGTELEAEEMRQHKAVWEGGIGRKRLATEQEIKTKKLPTNITNGEHIHTPSTRLYANFTGVKYSRNTTGYKRGINYEIQIFEIEGNVVMRGWDKKNMCIDMENIVTYKNFSSFLSNWTSICRNTSPSGISQLLQGNKTIKQLVSIR